jgi:hypothetical protein
VALRIVMSDKKAKPDASELSTRPRGFEPLTFGSVEGQ